MNLSLSYLLLFFVLWSTSAWSIDAGVLEWIWPENKDVEQEIGTDPPLISVPFESKTDDEKFLEEARKFTDIIKSSALDTCQHKVVLKIKTSCASMTEEELAKLSVNLLNCQSAVDGRQIFPCSSSMSLKECTEKMDATMWNAYHMMNNRARAVCLAARHAQFQALSEMTVNKLMSAARNQIQKMDTVVKSQNQLERLTLGTINLIEKGNIEILEQQDELKTRQKGMHDFISRNLHEFVREKALIAAGHKELSKMTESIKEKMDEANKQLHMQSGERMQYHKALLSDIETLHKLAQDIFQRIDASTDKLLLQHAEAATKYQEAVKNLVKINETIHYLLDLVDSTRVEIDKKFNWVQGFLDNTGIQLEKISAIAYHIVYLLIGMLLASFLNISTLSRFVLTLAVPLNLFLSYVERTDLALDYIQMTAALTGTILTIAIVSRLIKLNQPQSSIQYNVTDNNISFGKEEVSNQKSNRWYTFRRLLDKLFSMFNNIIPSGNHWMRKPETSKQENGYGEHYPSAPYLEGNMENYDYYTPTFDRRSEVSSHSLVRDWLQNKVPTPKSASSASSNSQKLCSAICRSSRRRCRNLTSRGSDYCYRHNRGQSEVD